MPAPVADAPAEPSPPAPEPRRPARRPTWRHAPLAVLLAVYLAVRIRILTGFTVYTSFDTTSYADTPGNTLDLLSFTGDAPRPWGVPLLFALVDTDPARATLQWTISTLAWSALIVACWLTLRSLPARIVAACAAIGLALSRSVYPWDHAILSESLSISLGVAALALLMIWVRTRSRAAVTALSLVTLWWIFTRQDVLPYVVLLLVVLGGYLLLRRYRVTAAVAVVVLLAGLAWQSATVSRTDEAYRSWYSGLSLSEATFLYRLRFQVLRQPQVKAAYQQDFGMPGCADAEQIARGTPWKMTEFIAAYQGCPDLVDWARREKDSVAYRYALAHPGDFTESVWAVLPATLGGTTGRYGKPVPGVPHLPERVFFPEPKSVPTLAGLIAVLAAGAGLLAGGFRRARWVAAAGGLLVLTSTASAVAGTLFTAGESARFGIQEAVLLRVGLILLVAAAIDAVAATITDRRTPTPGTGTTDPATGTTDTQAATDRARPGDPPDPAHRPA